MKILVLTSCTSKKKYFHEEQLNDNDFNNKDKFNNKINILKDFAVPALEMYEGDQHLRIKEGLEILKNKYQKELDIDCYIISAGFGLISSDTLIYPYNSTFAGKGKTKIREIAKRLTIPEKFKEIAPNYSLVIILLGEDYLTSLDLNNFEFPSETKFIFFANKGGEKLIPNKENIYILETGNALAKKYSIKAIELKGYLFKIISLLAEKKGMKIFETLKEHSDKIPSLVENAIKIAEKNVEKHNDCRKIKWEKSDNVKLKYFVPQWEDRVDPGYDFINDLHTPGRIPDIHDVYAHELYPEIIYDGILISISVVENVRRQSNLMKKFGVHNYFRVPQNFPIIGDCGAFSYINDDIPPYTTEKVIDFYSTVGVNYGVSIDHLIIPSIRKKGENGEPYNYELTEEDKKNRWNITMDNAKKFLEVHSKKGCSFTPIGVAQGWTCETYREGVKRLIEMGYNYIAIGGMVRSQSKEILQVLKEVKKELKPGVKIHLFGIARLSITQDLVESGVTSIDSASYLRKAWLSSSANYYDVNNNPYTAIRIPMLKNQKSIKNINKNIKVSSLIKLEDKCLELLRKYDKGQSSVDEVIENIRNYEIGLGKESGLEERYRKTLREKPWKTCPCSICKDIGIEVIIFRGNNRNRRRGFHNLWAFYKNLTDILENPKKRNVQIGLPFEEDFKEKDVIC